MGVGGVALIWILLPGPDVVEEMIGLSRPHSPNSGTVTRITGTRAAAWQETCHAARGGPRLFKWSERHVD